MSKKKENEVNYVEKVPKIIQENWTVLEDGIVEVTVENKGFYNTLAQKLFKKPRYSFIKLDENGSCVWQLIDGKKTIYEIGQILEKEQKEAGTQLYERLCTYCKILENNKYITFVEEK